MRARIVLVLLFVVVTCFKLLGCEGHNTYRLIKSVTLVDPPVENYKQVYLENDSKIILDYTVGKRPKEMGRNYGPPGHHWAEFSIKQSYRQDTTKLDYKIHRKRFDPSSRNLVRLPIIDMTKITPDNINTDYIEKYLAEHYKGKPLVAICMNQYSSNKIFIAYIPTDSEDLHFVSSNTLMGFAKYSYVPIENYVKVAALYPLAALLDVVISPLTFFIPRVDDR